MTYKQTISSARQFALDFHGNQMYGSKPYVSGHVDLVVQVLKEFGYSDYAWQAAGYLHDVVEDTNATIEMVRDIFGKDVADLVWAVTGVGHNRKTRNASIAEKITAFPRAAVLKLADRIVNAEAASLKDMYRKEQPAFAVLIRGHVPVLMWLRLEEALA